MGLNGYGSKVVALTKRGSTELSEAIKSMARWYREAQISYVYLSDVPSEPEK